MIIRTKALAIAVVSFLTWPLAVTAQECVGDADGDNEVTIDELITAVGNSLQGCGLSPARVAISGSVTATAGDAFRVWAVSEAGDVYATDADRETGRFEVLVPPDDWYVMGFGHYENPGAMHFAGHMVFPCHNAEDDHFFVGRGSGRIDLGTIPLGDDATFVRPEHDPLRQMDQDGDGIPDRDDPDTDCEDVGDRNGDGFHDDDMDHDGYHDDDRDRNGHSDISHHGGHGPGHM